ncbi:hypothetical protein HDU76_005760 [Blyttiomyces sp. JEL0837]|nr:hypothetical protein HDU76_005760 [Blyttiomyces sp. JEL0837]
MAGSQNDDFMQLLASLQSANSTSNPLFSSTSSTAPATTTLSSFATDVNGDVNPADRANALLAALQDSSNLTSNNQAISSQSSFNMQSFAQQPQQQTAFGGLFDSSLFAQLQPQSQPQPQPSLLSGLNDLLSMSTSQQSNSLNSFNMSQQQQPQQQQQQPINISNVLNFNLTPSLLGEVRDAYLSQTTNSGTGVSPMSISSSTSQTSQVQPQLDLSMLFGDSMTKSNSNNLISMGTGVATGGGLASGFNNGTGIGTGSNMNMNMNTGLQSLSSNLSANSNNTGVWTGVLSSSGGSPFSLPTTTTTRTSSLSSLSSSSGNGIGSSLAGIPAASLIGGLYQQQSQQQEGFRARPLASLPPRDYGISSSSSLTGVASSNTTKDTGVLSSLGFSSVGSSSLEDKLRPALTPQPKPENVNSKATTVEPTRITAGTLTQLAKLAEETPVFETMKRLHREQLAKEKVLMGQRKLILDKHEKQRIQIHADEIIGKMNDAKNKEAEADMAKELVEFNKYMFREMSSILKYHQAEMEKAKVPFFQVSDDPVVLANQKKVLGMLRDMMPEGFMDE